MIATVCKFVNIFYFNIILQLSRNTRYKTTCLFNHPNNLHLHRQDLSWWLCEATKTNAGKLPKVYTKRQPKICCYNNSQFFFQFFHLVYTTCIQHIIFNSLVARSINLFVCAMLFATYQTHFQHSQTYGVSILVYHNYLQRTHLCSIFILYLISY